MAREILIQHQQRQESYQRSLELASIDAPYQPPATLEAKVAEPSLPERLKLTKLWSIDVASVGNLLVTEDKSGPRWFVLSGWREVVELSPEGTVVARHPLAVPADAGVALPVDQAVQD